MTKPLTAVTQQNPWQQLRQFTRARIALGRAGHSQTTDTVLAFGLAHAQARDAVHLPLDCAAVESALDHAGFASLRVHSAAPDRAHYLRRPDLGRRSMKRAVRDWPRHAQRHNPTWFS